MAEIADKLLEAARGKFGKLQPAEAEIVRQAAAGEWADFREGDDTADDPAHADQWGDERRARAEFIAWLAADPEATALVHWRGLQIAGVRVEGEIDLSDATIPYPLGLQNCAIKKGLNLTSATADRISLDGSHSGPISADGLWARYVRLGSGFLAHGEVGLVGAHISGDLDCSGGRFEYPDGNALIASRAEIQGDVRLRSAGEKEFFAQGVVWLRGARISGDLDCSGGRFEHRDGIALRADGADIHGNVIMRPYLSNDFSAQGVVWLRGVRISGDLDCSGGRFETRDGIALRVDGADIHGNVFLGMYEDGSGTRPFDARGEVNLDATQIAKVLDCKGGRFRNPGKTALTATDGARIGGVLDLRMGAPPEGAIDLSDSRADTVALNPSSWPKPGELRLEGFQFDHVTLDGPHRYGRTWVRWLRLQPADATRVQPYQQLAKVLREMGLEEEARVVSIARQRIFRSRLLSDLSGSLSNRRRRIPELIARIFWSYFIDFSIGFGFRPWKAVGTLAALWLLAIGLLSYYDVAEVMCPSDSFLHEGRAACEIPETPRPFVPVVYTLDALIPFLDLRQYKYWEPNPQTAKGYGVMVVLWFYVGFGWILSILAAVGFSGVLRKD